MTETVDDTSMDIEMVLPTPSMEKRKKTISEHTRDFCASKPESWMTRPFWNNVPVKEAPYEPIPPPPIDREEEFLSTLSFPLLPHQIQGVRWMKNLEDGNPGKGGILADDMGTGKTLTCCSLVSHSFFLGDTLPQLIVCPKSVVSHWIAELSKCGVTNVMRLNSKTKNTISDRPDSKDYVQVVLSTFEALGKKDSPDGGPSVISWERIIIDEAHTVKNPKGKAYLAVLGFKARRKWAVTGTPMMNHVRDVMVLSNIVTPGEPFAFNDPVKERAWKRKYFLRRLKKDVNLQLPGETRIEEWLEMLPEDRVEYRDIERSATASFDEKKQVSNLLPLLAQLRQHCDHPMLKKGSEFSLKFEEEREKAAPVKKRKRASYLEVFEEEPVSGGDPSCSECPVAVRHSAKTKRMVEIIESYPADTKFVVFSQWTAMLDICEAILRTEGVGYLRFDGSVHDISIRASIIDSFKEDRYRVMLASLRAGGVGVNLTEANVIILLDPWWNYPSEEQASNRVYRIGQKKKVVVHRLLTKDTIEEQVIDIQKKKNVMNETFMDEACGRDGALSMKELKFVFGGMRRQRNMRYGFKASNARSKFANIFPKIKERSDEYDKSLLDLLVPIKS